MITSHAVFISHTVIHFLFRVIMLCYAISDLSYVVELI